MNNKWVKYLSYGAMAVVAVGLAGCGAGKAADEAKTGTVAEAVANEAVDPDLKAFLDSYEDFVDEYVVFMKKYNADPSNAVSMANEYTEILKREADYAEKLKQYDSSEMSSADAAYYAEVTGRCSKKMLDVMPK